MTENKHKILTFSYDDGTTQDIRLVELFNKYGMKATFNLNSGKLGCSNASCQSSIPSGCDRYARKDH